VQRILINYRRTDSAAYVNRLYAELCDRFGEDGIFKDVDTIEPGRHFREVIERTVRSADLMLVVIGPHWLADADGYRFDDPHDYVRLELEAALRSNIRIIPIIVGNAKMPSSEDLPATLAGLNRRQAFEIRDAAWQFDVNELWRRLSHMLGRPPDRPEARPRRDQDSTPSWLRVVAEKLRVARRS
jgi:TIR domain